MNEWLFIKINEKFLFLSLHLIIYWQVWSNFPPTTCWSIHFDFHIMHHTLLQSYLFKHFVSLYTSMYDDSSVLLFPRIFSSHYSPLLLFPLIILILLVVTVLGLNYYLLWGYTLDCVVPMIIFITLETYLVLPQITLQDLGQT